MTTKELIFKSFRDQEVQLYLNKFKNNKNKLKFFTWMLKARNFEDLEEGQVLELVKGVAMYVSKVQDANIEEEINFFKHKTSPDDLVRQTYHVYSSPKKV